SQKAVTLPTEFFTDRSDGAFAGKAAVVFQPRRGTVIRISGGSAFRSPSVIDLYRDTRLSSGSLLLGNASLNPETMISWEAGLRQTLGARVSVDVAYYDNHIRNLIFRSIDLALDPTGLTSRNLNAGRARSVGVEVATTVRASSWLTLRPTYTYTDPKITGNTASPQTVGKQIPFVPRHAAAGTASATVKRVTMTATARYQSAVFATDTNTDTTRNVPGAYDEFFETDIAANVKLHRLISASVSVDNIFDRHYYLFYRNPGRLVWAGARIKY
ncbi:MAG TPA: TonB-dependent receptor, partial [Vicinamibacterales bacterium]|nr:TonB-dependent receptor [Vicinamibacterales bacterium]